MSNLHYCLERAEECARLAADAKLPNERERYRRSEMAWRAKAEAKRLELVAKLESELGQPQNDRAPLDDVGGAQLS